MINRREFMGTVAVSLLVAPRPARGQQDGRIYRVGVLSPIAPFAGGVAASVPASLRELGYVEGRNLVVESRHADGKLERLPGLVRELVQHRMDVIVAVGTAASRAAKNETTTIPIVIFDNLDPVAAGLVPSLARPGGNLTGILIAPDGTLAAKKLELLKEAVPRATRIAFLAVDDPSFRSQVEETQRAASSLGVELLVVAVRNGDYERAFASIAAGKPGALFVGASTFFSRDRKRIIDLALKHRLPAMYEWPDQAEDGGLMALGSNRSELVRRMALYIDRIFKGAKPGDLPIEQPAKLELVINLKTAKAIGLALPPSLLARADRVIQ